MADVAQLVRASVCGTECRRFESGHPPHKFKNGPNGPFLNLYGRVGLEPAKPSSTASKRAKHSAGDLSGVPRRA